MPTATSIPPKPRGSSLRAPVRSFRFTTAAIVAISLNTWVDIGSSYTLSELSAAWLCGQLEQLSRIQARRQEIWDRYFAHLEAPVQRVGATILKGRPGTAGNAHLFAIVFRSGEQRRSYIAHMREQGICCAFHYVALHTSPMGRQLHDGRPLPGS